MDRRPERLELPLEPPLVKSILELANARLTSSGATATSAATSAFMHGRGSIASNGSANMLLDPEPSLLLLLLVLLLLLLQLLLLCLVLLLLLLLLMLSAADACCC